MDQNYQYGPMLTLDKIASKVQITTYAVRSDLASCQEPANDLDYFGFSQAIPFRIPQDPHHWQKLSLTVTYLNVTPTLYFKM
jgi:hypothetical protein